MSHTQAVGIDLGTTNSAAAWIDPSGRSAMVRNREGELLTPSVVFFDDAEVVVGKDARTAAAVRPDCVAEWVKREMGARAYSHPIRGGFLPPEVIQACILRKLRADIVDVLGPEVEVVITVPAYFDEPRRKATADAGEMAGLAVLDIVNEPTAAALSFGEVHGFLTPAAHVTEKMTVLVYDLGGGTFDVTLLELAPGDVRTLATDGDVLLGGHDWDMRLANHAAEAFKQSHGVDPRDDPAALSRLLTRVVEAKHTLSARSHAVIRVDHAGSSIRIEVARDEFEDLTADLLERTAYTTRQLLATARVSWSQVSRVLLVGGSTRMPMVVRMLQQISGMAPDHTVHPDEAVARGAALYASHLLAKARVRAEGPPMAPGAPMAPGEGAAPGGPSFQVTNVNSHSLGVEGIEPETSRKSNVVLIPRNTPLPATFTEEFATKRADQRSIVIQVLEGESRMPDECTAIGRTVIRDLPAGLPQGWPVEVTFEYGANGRLNVRAVVPGTQREVALELQRDRGLSSEGIARWQQTVASSPGFDAFESMLEDVLGFEAEAPAPTATREPGLDEPHSWTAVTETTSPVRDAIAAPSAASPAGTGANAAAPSAASPTSRATPMMSEAADLGSRERPRAASGYDQPAPGALRQPPRARTSGRLVTVVGFIVSAIVGLGLGYLLIWWLFPGSRLLPPW
jgi:molecular chaperone DnaK